jgi:hypothetical protein
MGLVTIIYCLRFEISLFVASYDSQGYGGGIRPRLHTGGNIIKAGGIYSDVIVRERERSGKVVKDTTFN